MYIYFQNNESTSISEQKRNQVRERYLLEKERRLREKDRRIRELMKRKRRREQEESEEESEEEEEEDERHVRKQKIEKYNISFLNLNKNSVEEKKVFKG